MGTLKSLFTRLSLSWRGSAVRLPEAFGPISPGLLQGCRIWDSSCIHSVTVGHSCSGTKQDVLFAPLFSLRVLLYLTLNEGKLFCTAHFWVVWHRRANILFHVALLHVDSCKQSNQGTAWAAANCLSKAIKGVLWMYSGLGIPFLLAP